jgi:hypothetical protein
MLFKLQHYKHRAPPEHFTVEQATKTTFVKAISNRKLSHAECLLRIQRGRA